MAKAGGTGRDATKKIADDLRWSRAQVSQYAMLNKICKEAWETIATSFQNTVAEDDDDAVAISAADVAKSKFSENLLRNILDSAVRYFQSD